MGDNLDRMRKAAKGAIVSQPQGKIVPPQGGSGTAPPQKEAKYSHRCGHAFTADEIKAHDCVACHRQNQCKRRRESQERKATKTVLTDRLPHGSEKHLCWNAETQMWSGTLVVPGITDAFAFAAPSEKKCYHGLHELYVAFRAAQKTEG